MYITTINQNGLILLNKAARKELGVEPGDRVVISFDKKQARVEREMTDAEFFEKLDAMKSESTKQKIRKLAGKTLDELEDNWFNSKKFKTEMEEKYGF